MIALLPHKIAVILLLSSMLVNVDRVPRIIHGIVFAIALPLGILTAGIVASETDNKWVMIILGAIGAGAVFHVAMLEMLPEALNSERRILKLLLAMVGSAAIAILKIWDHSESEPFM